MKEYRCVVKLEIAGFNYEANDENQYRQMVKEQFYEDYGIELVDAEITEVESSVEDVYND
jgi:hypothetical protein